MLVISDTNILGSFAAGEAIPSLFRLFPRTTIFIPPAVHQELQVGLNHGQTHLKSVLEALDQGKLQLLHLSNSEKPFTQQLPKKLNAGECEAIALSQARKALLLSNDKRAVRYCREHGIKVVDLPVLLRWLWTKNIVSQAEAKVLLDKMKTVENLQLSQNALATVFAPR